MSKRVGGAGMDLRQRVGRRHGDGSARDAASVWGFYTGDIALERGRPNVPVWDGRDRSRMGRRACDGYCHGRCHARGGECKASTKRLPWWLQARLPLHARAPPKRLGVRGRRFVKMQAAHAPNFGAVLALMPVATPVPRRVLCLSPSMHRSGMGSDDCRVQRHLREDRLGRLAQEGDNLRAEREAVVQSLRAGVERSNGLRFLLGFSAEKGRLALRRRAYVRKVIRPGWSWGCWGRSSQSRVIGACGRRRS